MVRIDEAALIDALTQRVRASLPVDLQAKAPTVGSHFEYTEVIERGAVDRDAALRLVVQHVDEALFGVAYELSEAAREPYGGCVLVVGDVLEVRFGLLPRVRPEDVEAARVLEPIPLGEFLIDAD